MPIATDTLSREECRARGCCPVADAAQCRSREHPRYCALACRDRARKMADPGYPAPYLAFLAGEGRERDEAAPPPPFADAVTRFRLARDCPHRGEKVGHGCTCLYRCALGRGGFRPGEVSFRDCLECPETDPDRVPSPATPPAEGVRSPR